MVWGSVSIAMLAVLQLYLFASIVVQAIRDQAVHQESIMWLLLVILTTLAIFVADHLVSR